MTTVGPVIVETCRPVHCFIARQSHSFLLVEVPAALMVKLNEGDMRKLFRSAVFVVLALGFIVICFLVIPKRPARPVLPFPNGYDDFLKAAQNAVSQRWPYGEGSDGELRELVDENRSALELARAGCERNCRVAIDYSVSAPTYATQHIPILAQFKKLAWAFRFEGELAEREGRTNDAARVYLDGIRFGQEFCRGGLVIDRLVDIACEAINFAPLSNLVQNVDARTCRDVAQGLETMEAKREPWESTLGVERLYFRNVANMRENLLGTVQRMIRWCQSWWRPVQDPRQKLERVQGWERRLTLQLAVRAYELEHEKAPERTADLAPAYLKAVPKDPMTGREMAL